MDITTKILTDVIEQHPEQSHTDRTILIIVIVLLAGAGAWGWKQRNQRIKRIEEGKDSWQNLLRMLEDEKQREKAGIYASKMKAKDRVLKILN